MEPPQRLPRMVVQYSQRPPAVRVARPCMTLSFRPLSLLALLWALTLPAQAQGALEQAQSHWYAGRQTEAVNTLEAALASQPRDAKLRFVLAWMRQEQGQTGSAEQLLRALIEEFPDHGEAQNNLAVILAQRGELDAAQQLLERAVQLHPEHWQAQENLGDLLLRLAQRAYLRAAQSPAPAAVQLKLKLLEPLLRAPQR